MALTNFPNGITSMGVPALNTMGVGNVYHVVDSSAVFYQDFNRNRKTTYSDGSVNLHATIASALAATVECRNDYVVVWPKNADYDITAALVMDKKAVHLVCPAGMGYTIGSNNAVRIEQTTDDLAVIAVSDAAVEIAGFYLKPDPTSSGPIITMAATSYAPNIHHNYFTLKIGVAGAGILGAGDGCAWGKIERNKFENQVSSQTYATIIGIGSSATGAEVSHNQISVGNGSTATVGISNGAVLGNTNFNIFSECGGSGVASGGTITKCIAINGSACAIGNIGAVGTGQMLSGGTTLHSYAENYGAYIANTGTTNGSVEA